MELVKLSRARQALEEAKTLQEIKDIKDLGTTAKKYAQAKGLGRDMVNAAAQIEVRAIRGLGKMIPKHQEEGRLRKQGQSYRGSPVSGRGPLPENPPPSLNELRISKYESSTAQKMAEIDDTDFEELLAGAKHLTVTYMLRHGPAGENSERPALPEIPQGKYSVIYTDPPWPVGSIDLGKWQNPIDAKYPTMNIDEIKRLPVTSTAADDCSLFMWTTHTFLPDALAIIKHWGFKYHCLITWDKGGGWTQFGFHRMTEFLVYAYQGRMNVDQSGKAIPTLISEKKTYHSKKPDSIRELIEKKTPGPRLEMFARDKYEGWVSWGNQVEND